MGLTASLLTPCRVWCRCYADDFVTGLFRPPWELFHQHLSCLFSHSPPSSLLQSSREETLASTASQRQTKMPAKLNPRFVTSGEDRRIKRKDLSGNGRRDITTDLGPGIVSPSLSFHSQMRRLSQPGRYVLRHASQVSRGSGERQSDGGSWKPITLKGP